MIEKPFRRYLTVFALAALTVALLPASLAHSAEEILLEDDFTEVDSAFSGDADLDLTASDNILKGNLKKENLYYRLLYQSVLAEDIDLTAKVRLGDPSGESGNCIGIVFWATDHANYYCLEISDSGTFTVFHQTTDKWLTPISWRSSEAIKTDPGEWNELRVVCVGKRAKLYINGKEVGKIRGEAPADGGLFGYLVWSGTQAGERTYEFSSMKAVVPADSGKPAVAEDPNLIFADNFETLDPGWGTETGFFGVKDNKMFVKLDANQAYHPLFQAEDVQDIDATVKLSMNDGNAEAVSGAGFTFWATDFSTDYWNVEIYDNGTVSVWRKNKDRWLNPAKAKPIPPECKVDFAKPNELRMVTAGRKMTLSINGIEALKLNGQPPKGGWFFGFQCDTGEKAGATFEFSDLVVKKP